MKIKRFQATSMREAIRMVREEQGADAVILSNRRIPGGVEVVAATDYDAALVHSAAQRQATAPTTASSEAQAAAAAASAHSNAHSKPGSGANANSNSNSETDGADAAQRWSLLRRREKKSVQPAAAASAKPATAVITEPASAHETASALFAAPAPTPPRTSLAEPASTPSRAPQTQAASPSASAPREADPVSEDTHQLRSELQSLRALLEEQLAGLRWGDMQKHRPRQAQALRALVQLGLEPELAREIAEELPEAADADRARFLPLGLLGRRLPVEAGDPILSGGIVALVGPTGVGKTTTVAKLAARYAQVHGVRDIALVTTDHYRIGAQEQLFTYGRLLGVPVHAVGAGESLASVLGRLSDRRLILIDTAGLSQRDKALVRQLDTLRSLAPRLKTWLVLAANAQPGAQDDTVKRFGQLPLSGLCLTKLDEAHRLGGTLSVAVRHGLPLLYLADGQRVPEDLQAARADRLVLRATQMARQSASPIDESQLLAGFYSAFNSGSNSVAHANG